MDTLHDWKDNEYGYCLELLRTNGNSDVPRDSIRSYFEVQVAAARRAGRIDVWFALEKAYAAWIRERS